MSSSIPTPPHGSMSSTTPSSSNFHLISNALSDYAKQTDIDLTKNPFADQFHSCDSAEAISQLLQDRVEAFKAYRNEHRKLIKCLNPVFQFLHAFNFSTTLGDAVSKHAPSGSYFYYNFTLQPSGTISTCESSLCRHRCPPPSIDLLHLS
jgi:hypothetical protein